MTLALMGSSDGETEPKKVTYVREGHRLKSLLHWNSFPPNFDLISARVQGIQ
jgi:hypothetical protein